MVSNAEIIDFVTSRIVQDIAFLASHNFISKEDEAIIRGRLPNGGIQPQAAMSMPVANPGYQQTPTPAANGAGLAAPAPGGVQGPSPTFPLKHIGGPTPSGAASPVDPSALKRAVPPIPINSPKRPEFCRALWDYNVDYSEPNDLMFRKNDIIEISEETNTDWWTGICRGRTGLFPSNHAQKIPYDPHLFSTAPDGGTPPGSQVGTTATLYEKPRYPGQMAGPPAHMGQNTQPAPGTMGPPFQQYPQQQQQQQDPNGEQKKNKFGKVGGQLGGALVNGVGFGAGAAVGSGIINAIF
ncbi:hypothetical protein FS837_003003 [Tulasnella sp. UAMH 9824]|nr:hypothetical protein FS837_003003 [Tulasnella sp. UAMH 9824]